MGKGRYTVGEFIWVICGKVDHPAYRVTNVPPRTDKDGTMLHFIQWQLQGTYEYVAEYRIKTNIGSRRPRKLSPEQSTSTSSSSVNEVVSKRQLRNPSKTIQPLKTVVQSKKVENKVTKLKETTKKTKISRKSSRNMESVVPPITTSLSPSLSSSLSRLPPPPPPPPTSTTMTKFDYTKSKAEKQKRKAAINPWAQRLVQRAKRPKILYDRPPKEGDTLFIGEKMYVVTGFSTFHNRFEHIPDLLELRNVAARERRYILPRHCKLYPQEGQVTATHDSVQDTSCEKSDTESFRNDHPLPPIVTSQSSLSSSFPVTTTDTEREKNVATRTTTTISETTTNTWKEPVLSQSLEPEVKFIPPWAERLMESARQPRILCDRPASEGDIVCVDDDVHVVTGFSVFYNRFQHIPNLIEVKNVSKGIRHHFLAQDCHIDPQVGQICPKIQENRLDD